MPPVAIQIDGVSKQYHLGQRQRGYQTLRDRLAHGLRAPWHRRAGATTATLWALQEVSCDIARGDFVAIIGGNGAGKSTLLKILSRVTEPTAGAVTLHGRVGSLLEVGMGFHPELTGRENIYLSGAILGMTRAEIARKFDAIVAFAELEQFLDTAVKHYSSGMYVRLGFAVAVHLEPEILLVDEVLAVGDVRFATKCEQKMRALNAQGTTIVLVTHQLWFVQTLCSRAICLEQGRLIADGAPLPVIRTYRTLGGPGPGVAASAAPPAQAAADILRFEVQPYGPWPTAREASPAAGLTVGLTAQVHQLAKVKLFLRVASPDGFPYFTVYSEVLELPASGRFTCEATIPQLMLLPGEYCLWGGICPPEGETRVFAEEKAPLYIAGEESGDRRSCFWNQAHWHITYPD
jgi:ABC-type polysaccharide/polyol phosphate transport system ATPase subunit